MSSSKDAPGQERRTELEMSIVLPEAIALLLEVRKHLHADDGPGFNTMNRIEQFLRRYRR